MTWRCRISTCACAWTAPVSAATTAPPTTALFDIGYLRHVPNLVFMQPKDEEEFVDMLWTMANYQRRSHCDPLPARRGRRREAQGAAQAAGDRQGRKWSATARGERPRVAIFGLGNMCAMAEEAADLLEKEGISAAVINPRWIKPMDTDTLELFARSAEVICTLEDHVLPNGFGCAVMEALGEARITTPVVRLGWPDQFIEHGTIPILRKKHGLTAEALVARVRPLLKTGRQQPVSAA